MRKIRLFLLVILASCLVFCICSYTIAKRKAVAFTTKYGDPARLSASLTIFPSGTFRPTWIFSYEMADVMTGCRFEVDVSLMGRILYTCPAESALERLRGEKLK